MYISFWPYSWALRSHSVSMGNKSFSSAVLPLHSFISVLIFMYLEKCCIFFFFEKKYWHSENNLLGFYNSHVI